MEISGIPLRQMEGVIKGVRRYCRNGWQYLRGQHDELYGIVAWSDYDGYPFADVVKLVYFPRGSSPLDENTLIWRASIVYSDTTGDVYDYVKKAQREGNWRSVGEPTDVKFKIDDGYTVEIRKAAGDVEAVKARIIWLEKHLGEMDRLVDNISEWSASGIGMIAFCSGRSCFRSSVVPSKTIAAFAARGLSAAEASEKMVCRKCGSRAPVVLPDVCAPL